MAPLFNIEYLTKYRR